VPGPALLGRCDSDRAATRPGASERLALADQQPPSNLRSPLGQRPTSVRQEPSPALLAGSKPRRSSAAARGQGAGGSFGLEPGPPGAGLLRRRTSPREGAEPDEEHPEWVRNGRRSERVRCGCGRAFRQGGQARKRKPGRSRAIFRPGACEAGAEGRAAPPSAAMVGAEPPGTGSCGLVRAGSALIARDSASRLRRNTALESRARRRRSGGAGVGWLVSSVPRRCPGRHRRSKAV